MFNPFNSSLVKVILISATPFAKLWILTFPLSFSTINSKLNTFFNPLISLVISEFSTTLYFNLTAFAPSNIDLSIVLKGIFISMLFEAVI